MTNRSIYRKSPVKLNLATSGDPARDHNFSGAEKRWPLRDWPDPTAARLTPHGSECPWFIFITQDPPRGPRREQVRRVKSQFPQQPFVQTARCALGPWDCRVPSETAMLLCFHGVSYFFLEFFLWRFSTKENSLRNRVEVLKMLEISKKLELRTRTTYLKNEPLDKVRS